MTFLILLVAILVLIGLLSWANVHAFLAFLLVAIGVERAFGLAPAP